MMRRTMPRVMKETMRRMALSFQTSTPYTWSTVQPRMMNAMVRKTMSLLMNPRLSMISPTTAQTMDSADPS